jgi:uncharacterized protein YukE
LDPTNTSRLEKTKQLELLKRAYFSGALKVRYSDYEVSYQSAENLRRAIAELERELGHTEKMFLAKKVITSNGL